jgi:hypothetical protein
VAKRVPRSDDDIAALAPSSAALVRATVTAEGGSVRLAEAVKACYAGSPIHVRWPTSDLGVATPEHQDALRILESAGSIEVQIVYDTVAPESLATDLAILARGDYGLYFASPSAVANTLPLLATPPKRVVCLGRSTCDHYAALLRDGFPREEYVKNEASFLELAQ